MITFFTHFTNARNIEDSHIDVVHIAWFKSSYHLGNEISIHCNTLCILIRTANRGLSLPLYYETTTEPLETLPVMVIVVTVTIEDVLRVGAEK